MNPISGRKFLQGEHAWETAFFLAEIKNARKISKLLFLFIKWTKFMDLICNILLKNESWTR